MRTEELRNAVDTLLGRDGSPAGQLDEAAEKYLEGLLWEVLLETQHRPFQTVKKLEFTYTIRGNEMFVDRKDKSITRATIELTLKNALKLQMAGEKVTGPKKLGTFGASYLWPVFMELGIIRK
ncbi:MAG: hypothetical protein Q4C91_10965 [Eubacteriales bacterium]|nr:hypothetical protein [Eubacteriales bacterium]